MAVAIARVLACFVCCLCTGCCKSLADDDGGGGDSCTSLDGFDSADGGSFGLGNVFAVLRMIAAVRYS